MKERMVGSAKSFDPTLADGTLLLELGGSEEAALLAKMQEAALGNAAMEEVGAFWQLACLRARKYDVDRAIMYVQARRWQTGDLVVYKQRTWQTCVQSGWLFALPYSWPFGS